MTTRDRFNIYRSKYFYMLIVLICYFIGISILSSNHTNIMPSSLLFTLMIIFCVYILLREKLLIYYIASLAGFSILFHYALNYSLFGFQSYIIYYVADILFLIVGSFAVIYSIAKHKSVTADTLCGAICGYMLLGLTWSFIYLLIDALDSSSFSKLITSTSLHESFLNATYYSFTTMTTLGYGDILPVSYLARTCSWLEAVSGQIYLAVWISQLVGLRISQQMNNHLS